MSPYQNCIRDIDKRIEEVRNQLATETEVTKRDELELENKDLISQKNQIVQNNPVGKRLD